ncbi:uncharacterized protein LOC129590554 [Paramacrobiotus metropolitanus]|uniref:uncharacterized protein LOC129590554 n=1 Tax=Paramacrobiotus metropolitanus TaxID=2943436 RepID=UPI002445C169|nr:uncharacterized protein LOC129590554 [Paramacrobiotus metropolitanus]
MSIYIDASAFQEITSTMRQLKSLLDRKLQEQLTVERCYQDKCHNLFLQLQQATNQLKSLQDTRTSLQQRHDSELHLLTSQVEFLKKEVQVLKCSECVDPARSQMAPHRRQIEQLERSNQQLSAELTRWQALHNIVRKEMGVVVQLQSSRQGLRADHEQWLMGAYRALEDNYRNLLSKYTALQRQQGCDLCHETFVETLPAETPRKSVNEDGPRKSVTAKKSVKISDDTKVEEPVNDNDNNEDGEKNGDNIANDMLPNGEVNKVTVRKSVKGLDQIENAPNDPNQTDIPTKKSLNLNGDKKSQSIANATQPEMKPSDSDKEKVIETLQQERRESLKKIDELNDALKSQKEELVELKKDRRFSSAASIKAQESAIKSTEAEKATVENRVKSISKSLSIMQSNSAENERLKNENSVLKQELRKSLDLVDRQAFQLKKEKRSFFDETDSSVSIDEHPAVPGGEPSATDASSHEFDGAGKPTADLGASSLSVAPATRKSTNPSVVVTAPSGEASGNAENQLIAEKRKSSGMHLEPPRKSVIQRKSSEGKTGQ